jgi:hypothetical protein
MQNRDKLQEHVGVEYSTFTRGKQSLLSCKLGYAARQQVRCTEKRDHGEETGRNAGERDK